MPRQPGRLEGIVPSSSIASCRMSSGAGPDAALQRGRDRAPGTPTRACASRGTPQAATMAFSSGTSRHPPALTRMIPLLSLRSARALFTLLLTLVIAGPARAADDFLDPDKAFVLGVRVLDAKRLELSYKVAPGYYLYRERFK